MHTQMNEALANRNRLTNVRGTGSAVHWRTPPTPGGCRPFSCREPDANPCTDWDYATEASRAHAARPARSTCGHRPPGPQQPVVTAHV